MDSLGYAISQRFLSLKDNCLDELGVIALVFSGSTLYHHAENGTLNHASDFDMALFVNSKDDIGSLLGSKRHLLMRVLCIVREEEPPLQLPIDTCPSYEQLDGVRFAGHDAAGLKRSVKILSLEYFRSSSRCINLLSRKDRRVYSGFTLDGFEADRFQQATKLDGGLVLLHDPWLFEKNGMQSPHDKRHGVRAAFGVTADLLLTGLWFVGEDPFGRDVRRNIIDFASLRTGTAIESGNVSFARSPRFGKVYSDWLSNRWQSSTVRARSCEEAGDCEQPRTGPKFNFYGPMMDLSHLNRHRIPPNIAKLGSAQITLFLNEVANSDKIVNLPKTPFSSNSLTSTVALSCRYSEANQLKTVIFCKQTSQDHLSAECQGALLAASFLPHVQHPREIQGRALYPWFSGRSEAELQLEFESSQDPATWNIVLDAEMRKAEDMLRAYCMSLHVPRYSDKQTRSPSIHRFFHERLYEDCRIKSFYGKGVTVNGDSIPLETLCQLELHINGTRYSTLRSILDTAIDSLSCTSDAAIPIAFGLGDGHGGNVMVASEITQPARRLLYVDYEVTGFHSPLLDLAKPLYNDVFFRALYSDEIASAPKVRVKVDNGALIIDTCYGPSSLARAILGIKRRFLVEPLFQYALDQGLDLHIATGILSSALFACGFLTRNYSGNENAFFINLSISVALAAARTLEDIWTIAENVLSGGVSCPRS